MTPKEASYACNILQTTLSSVPRHPDYGKLRKVHLEYLPCCESCLGPTINKSGLPGLDRYSTVVDVIYFSSRQTNIHTQCMLLRKAGLCYGYKYNSFYPIRLEYTVYSSPTAWGTCWAWTCMMQAVTFRIALRALPDRSPDCAPPDGSQPEWCSLLNPAAILYLGYVKNVIGGVLNQIRLPPKNHFIYLGLKLLLKRNLKPVIFLCSFTYDQSEFDNKILRNSKENGYITYLYLWKCIDTTKNIVISHKPVIN